MNAHTDNPYADRFAVQASLTEAFSAALAKVPNMMMRCYRRSRQREVLANLSPRMLDDIGITRVDLAWAKGLPLDLNPLTALECRAREHARMRRLAARRVLPGTPAKMVLPLLQDRTGCV